MRAHRVRVFTLIQIAIALSVIRMADSAGIGSPQPGDVVTDGYVQVQDPSTSPGDKFSLENPSNEASMRRPGTAHTVATQLGGGGTPVSAAQAESQQPQSGAERLLKMRRRAGAADVRAGAERHPVGWVPALPAGFLSNVKLRDVEEAHRATLWPHRRPE